MSDTPWHGSTNKWWIIAGVVCIVDVLMAVAAIVLLINVLRENKKLKKKLADKNRKKPSGTQTDATGTKTKGQSKTTSKKRARAVDTSIKGTEEGNDDDQSTKVVCATNAVSKNSKKANERLNENPNKVTETFLFKP
ncbi:hypothetical protein M3Y95_00812700 [Aphelenchoides besseyi]|nr:hypothetical protein M3Y95_00812700 [Aphelenchoides besseyi]